MFDVAGVAVTWLFRKCLVRPPGDAVKDAVLEVRR